MEKNTSTSSSGVTLRAVLIGLFLIPANAYWITQTEVVLAITHATTLSLFFNVIFILFLLSLGNLCLRRFLPSLALSAGELLTIYSMLCMATSLLGWDMMQVLVPVMSYGTWFATPENEWRELFLEHLPQWLTVSDKGVLRGYYEGQTLLYQWHILKVWATPVLLWTSFIIVLYFTMICLLTTLRKRWIEEEKLSYPVIQLPLEMTSNAGSFFRSRSMWFGFALVCGIDLLHGLHYFYPFVPDFRVKYELGPMFTKHPWNAIGWLPVCFYPFVIGLAYFMPLDLSFSTWFFYLFWKAQLVFRAAFGLKRLSGPYLGDQSMGAWLALGTLSLWLSRRSIYHVFRTLWSTNHDDDSDEPLPYRWASLGGIIGIAFLVGFSVIAGMSIWVASGFFILYFILVTSATRMRAELGPPTHDLYYGGPDRMIPAVVGTRRLGAHNLSVMTLYFWITRDYRCHPMPHQLEAFKIAERVGLRNRRLVTAMLASTLIGTLAAFWAILHLFYEYGATSRVQGYALGVAWESYIRLQNWLDFPTETNSEILGQMGFGIVITTLLMILRRRFLNFPFHPVGYAVAGSWTMSWLWFSVFLSWSIKYLFLRSGGLRLYRKGVPFFLGLMLGQFVSGSFWSLLGVMTNRMSYGFFV